MNNKNEAFLKIIEFLNSSERVLLLKGTHQNQKHPLALAAVLTQSPKPPVVLFRVNHKSNIEDIVESVFKLKTKPQPGKPIIIDGSSRLYFDTINRSSWQHTPRDIDIAIVYPTDSLDSNRGEENLRDIINRNAKKILLVTWTDNKDYYWTMQYKPTIVIYDAEEEDPKYHQRVLDVIGLVPTTEPIKGLPKYAQNVPSEYLIQILCRGRCRKTRWAKMNKPYIGRDALRTGNFGDYNAECLMCGYIANDPYNWYR